MAGHFFRFSVHTTAECTCSLAMSSQWSLSAEAALWKTRAEMRETRRMTCGQGFVTVGSVRGMISGSSSGQDREIGKAMDVSDGTLTVKTLQWPVSADQLLNDRDILR